MGAGYVNQAAGYAGMANDLNMQMNQMFGGKQLQNLDFFSDLAGAAKDASSFIGQAADTYNQVAPIAGQAWGAIDPNSYNAYGKDYIDYGQ